MTFYYEDKSWSEIIDIERFVYTCSFPLSASVKEVSRDARALGIRAEMNSRRCWEAELELGSGREPREPTKLEKDDEEGRK